MRISEWSEDAARKAGSGAVSKALDRDDASVWGRGLFSACRRTPWLPDHCLHLTQCNTSVFSPSEDPSRTEVS